MKWSGQNELGSAGAAAFRPTVLAREVAVQAQQFLDARAHLRRCLAFEVTMLVVLLGSFVGVTVTLLGRDIDVLGALVLLVSQVMSARMAGMVYRELAKSTVMLAAVRRARVALKNVLPAAKERNAAALRVEIEEVVEAWAVLEALGCAVRAPRKPGEGA